MSEPPDHKNFVTTHTIRPNLEPPKGFYVDKYGQFVADWKWYNIFTWSPSWKYGAYGFISTVLGSMWMSAYGRRPQYAHIPYKTGCIALGTTVCYLYGKYAYEKKFQLRDATISHYMSLHPEDFKTIRTAGRKYREILLPWEPMRSFEKTVPLISDIKPSFFKEPTIDMSTDPQANK